MKRIISIRAVLILLAVYGICITTLVTVAVWSNPVQRAVLCMAWGLIVFWCFGGGIISRCFRTRTSNAVSRIPLNWKIKFILFATVMALIEEAVTVTMTNCAPLFGVKVGQAYITASANYLDVVCLHSVIVFVPMFVCWAFLLSRYNFRPHQVFFLFGLTGTLAEMSFAGIQAIAQIGVWMFVYGLMVYLPAYSVPVGRNVKLLRWWHWPLAVLLPFVFVIPVAGVISYIHPIKIHFPPIQ
ncbi:MAG: hypothetical protein ACYS30_07885 [Planctomycetota bacterium]